MKGFQSVACEKSYMDVAAVAPKAGKSSSSGLLFIVLTVKSKRQEVYVSTVREFLLVNTSTYNYLAITAE